MKKYTNERKDTLQTTGSIEGETRVSQGTKQNNRKTKKFDEEALDKFVEDYMDRTHHGSTQGGMFRSTQTSIMGVSRLSQVYQDYKETRDHRSLQNYERNMRIWKANVRCLNKKLGRKNPNSSLMSSQDL